MQGSTHRSPGPQVRAAWPHSRACVRTLKLLQGCVVAHPRAQVLGHAVARVRRQVVVAAQVMGALMWVGDVAKLPRVEPGCRMFVGLSARWQAGHGGCGRGLTVQPRRRAPSPDLHEHRGVVRQGAHNGMAHQHAAVLWVRRQLLLHGLTGALCRVWHIPRAMHLRAPFTHALPNAWSGAEFCAHRQRPLPAPQPRIRFRKPACLHASASEFQLPPAAPPTARIHVDPND